MIIINHNIITGLNSKLNIFNPGLKIISWMKLPIMKNFKVMDLILYTVCCKHFWGIHNRMNYKSSDLLIIKHSKSFLNFFSCAKIQRTFIYIFTMIYYVMSNRWKSRGDNIVSFIFAQSTTKANGHNSITTIN